MRLFSKLVCGFKHDGSPLLHEGLNQLAEPLSVGEREFIEAMLITGLVEIVSEEVPEGPASETKLRIGKTPKRFGESLPPSKKPMRVRRAVTK